MVSNNSARSTPAALRAPPSLNSAIKSPERFDDIRRSRRQHRSLSANFEGTSLYREPWSSFHRSYLMLHNLTRANYSLYPIY